MCGSGLTTNKFIGGLTPLIKLDPLAASKVEVALPDVNAEISAVAKDKYENALQLIYTMIYLCDLVIDLISVIDLFSVLRTKITSAEQRENYQISEYGPN